MVRARPGCGRKGRREPSTSNCDALLRTRCEPAGQLGGAGAPGAEGFTHTSHLVSWVFTECSEVLEEGRISPARDPGWRRHAGGASAPSEHPVKTRRPLQPARGSPGRGTPGPAPELVTERHEAPGLLATSRFRGATTRTERRGGEAQIRPNGGFGGLAGKELRVDVTCGGCCAPPHSCASYPSEATERGQTCVSGSRPKEICIPASRPALSRGRRGRGCL